MPSLCAQAGAILAMPFVAQGSLFLLGAAGIIVRFSVWFLFGVSYSFTVLSIRTLVGIFAVTVGSISLPLKDFFLLVQRMLRWVCLHVGVCAWVQVSEEAGGVGSLELELGDCELSDVGAGTKPRSCCRSTGAHNDWAVFPACSFFPGFSLWGVWLHSLFLWKTSLSPFSDFLSFQCCLKSSWHTILIFLIGFIFCFSHISCWKLQTAATSEWPGASCAVYSIRSRWMLCLSRQLFRLLQVLRKGFYF